MPATEDERRSVHAWAQRIVDTWGQMVKSGNAAIMPDDFKALFDRACRYRDASTLAENHRKGNMLTEREAAEEKIARQEFTDVYRAYHEKYDKLT